MFEDIAWFIIIFITSIILSNLLFRRDLGPFNTLRNILGLFGVIIHEISHFFMCKLLGVPTDGLQIKYRYKGYTNPHGSVSLKEIEKTSFMQAFLVGLAPLFFSTWLFFYILYTAFHATSTYLIIVSIFLSVSLLISASPSSTDFKQIGRAFNRDPNYSLYQIFLVFLSGLISWTIFTILKIDLFYGPISLFSIGIGYFTLKYSFRGINNFIKSRNKVDSIQYKKMTRKRINSQKSNKIGIREAQW
jgi:hypothetical protein